jgi:hypothetical protein
MVCYMVSSRCSPGASAYRHMPVIVSLSVPEHLPDMGSRN